MVDLVYCLTSLVFFDVPLLFYYINVNSSIVCPLSFGDIYLFFGILKYFVVIFFVILLAILLPFKSTVTSVVF